ncbi:MAG TPA: PP2C family protein-serine/threonine phosphatase [Labilithrix sp.]|nr:PP2C family protein-serine/threonine phosphatase [Labilithrix sp.]
MGSAADSVRAQAIARASSLEHRLDQLRAFGSLRRSLRVADELEDIAAAAQRFVLDVLGSAHFTIYCTDKEESDFNLLSSAWSSELPPGEEQVLPTSLERSCQLARDLETASSIRTGELLEQISRLTGSTAVAVAFRSSPTQLIGIGIISGGKFDEELLEELVFDVESALSSRMIARLRTEELAVLEIQERELVGLLREVEARDAIIQRDLEEARQFQRKMLGTSPRVDGAAIEIVYQPLGLVGGDLYAVSCANDRLRLFIADATGHGVRASLTTMFIKSGYEAVRPSAPDPASLLAALNDAIAHTYRSAEMLFSAACVDIDLKTGRVYSASAAHPAICIVRNGQASFVEGSGAFLGIRSGMKFSVQETVISPEDGVYLYTDGFVEARKNNQLFGDDRLCDAIVEAHQKGERAGDAVVAAVTAFLDGTPLDDDGTFIGVRYGVDDPAPSIRDLDAAKLW